MMKRHSLFLLGSLLIASGSGVHASSSKALDEDTARLVLAFFQNGGAEMVGKQFFTGASSAVKEAIELKPEEFQAQVKAASNALVKGIGQAFAAGEGGDAAIRDYVTWLRRRLEKGGDGDQLLGESVGAMNRWGAKGGDLDKASDIARGTITREVGNWSQMVKGFFEGKKSIGGTFSAGSKMLWNNILGRPLTYTVIGAAGMATAYYGSRTLWNYIDRYLKKPRLLIEYQRTRWFSGITTLFSSPIASPEMIFPPVLKERLNSLIEETKAIKLVIGQGKKNIKYRNILLYGDPGTGKTMFAKKLARESGMDFAFITGSSLFQEGAGIEAIDELFAWAKRSSNGLCLFIDEADSLFIERTSMDQSGNTYRIVNHMLNYLGERSDKFMVIATTNHHKTFDKAMERRIDEAIEMVLPGEVERMATLALYRDKVIADANSNTPDVVQQAKRLLDAAKLKAIAQQTEGFCYGDLEGIINKIQAKLLIAKHGITAQLIDTVVQEYCAKHAALRKASGVSARAMAVPAA